MTALRLYAGFFEQAHKPCPQHFEIERNHGNAHQAFPHHPIRHLQHHNDRLRNEQQQAAGKTRNIPLHGDEVMGVYRADEEGEPVADAGGDGRTLHAPAEAEGVHRTVGNQKGVEDKLS